MDKEKFRKFRYLIKEIIMSEKELSEQTIDKVLETVRYDNAVALSDDTFFNMMEDARARQAKDRDIDLPMVALRTLTSTL